jgi:hypothetical protein
MNIFRLIQKNTYPAHFVAFVLMILASVGMYAAAENGSLAWIWIWMAVFIVANFLALVAR